MATNLGVGDWVVFPTNPDTIADRCDGKIGRVLRVTPSGRGVVGTDDGEEYVVDAIDVRVLDD